MNRAVRRPIVVHLAILELACHTGGRGSESVAPLSPSKSRRCKPIGTFLAMTNRGAKTGVSAEPFERLIERFRRVTFGGESAVRRRQRVLIAFASSTGWRMSERS